MKRLLYLILKKDMIKRLKKYHGEQFIDDVMGTFGIPTDFMKKYQKNISSQINTTESPGYSHEVKTVVKSKPTKPPESYSIVFELDGLTFAEYNELWNILKQLKKKYNQ